MEDDLNKTLSVSLHKLWEISEGECPKDDEGPVRRRHVLERRVWWTFVDRSRLQSSFLFYSSFRSFFLIVFRIDFWFSCLRSSFLPFFDSSFLPFFVSSFLLRHICICSFFCWDRGDILWKHRRLMIYKLFLFSSDVRILNHDWASYADRDREMDLLFFIHLWSSSSPLIFNLHW